MMGHRIRLKSGDEVDAFSRFRSMHFWQRGELRRLKRWLSKRRRREARKEAIT